MTPVTASAIPLRTPVALHETAPTIEQTNAAMDVASPKNPKTSAFDTAIPINTRRNAMMLSTNPASALADFGFI